MASDKEILDYIKSQQEVSIPALQKKFSANYFDIVKLIRQLEADGKIRLDAGVRYSVLKEEEDEDEDDDEDNIMAHRRAYLEARRREILRLMQTDTRDDDDDDDDDEEEAETESLDDSDNAEGGSDEKMPFEAFVMTQELESGVPVIKSDGEFFFVPSGLVIGGKVVRFKISIREDGVFLSDNKVALHTLANRAPLDGEGMRAAIDAIVYRYDVDLVEDELQIEVGSPENAVTCMLQLFAAMERIVTIDEDDLAICIESSKENRRIWNAAKELLIADPDIDRGELVLRMRERYQSVKDGENIDDIIIFARAVKEFSGMTDEDYVKSRNILLEIGKRQDDGETDSAEKDGDVPVATDEAAGSNTAETNTAHDSSREADEYIDDPAYLKALAIVVQTGEASISLVQRKCDIGYNHAGKIIEWMEKMGYISSFDGKRKRRVFMTKEQFIKRYGPFD